MRRRHLPLAIQRQTRGTAWAQLSRQEKKNRLSSYSVFLHFRLLTRPLCLSKFLGRGVRGVCSRSPALGFRSGSCLARVLILLAFSSSSRNPVLPHSPPTRAQSSTTMRRSTSRRRRAGKHTRRAVRRRTSDLCLRIGLLLGWRGCRYCGDGCPPWRRVWY